MTRALRRSSALAAAMLAGLVVTTCSFDEPTCEDFRAESLDRAEREKLPATVLLVEVTDNRSAAAADVAADMEEPTKDIARHGGRLVVATHGGTDQEVVTGACFAADVAYLASARNEAKRDHEIDEAGEVLTAEIAGQIRATDVAETGSPVALLEQARVVVADLEDEHGTDPADIHVILRSDILGNGADCLDVTGVEATEQRASDLVQRCLDVGQIKPFPDGVRLSVVRTTGARGTGDSRFSGYLADALCSELATECTS